MSEDTIDGVLGGAGDAIERTTSSALLKAVCERLQSRIGSALAVEEFPDEPESYVLRHQVGALLVRYTGAKYAAPTSNWGAVVQDRTVLIDVVVVTRKLNGATGTTTWIEVVRLILTGHEPAGFGRLVPVREQYEGRGDRTWLYAITFGAAALAVELAEDELGELIARITLAGDLATDLEAQDG